MTNSIESDACIVRLDYRKAMIDVNTQLGRRDVESLKFLCSDFIPVGKMERIRNGLDIVQELQQMCLIVKPNNVLFLAELLWLVGRIDLVRKLNTCENEVKSALSSVQFRHVSPYRILLYNICQDLTQENVDDIKFLCVHLIPRSTLETIQDPRALIRVFEHCKMVQPSDLHFLSSKLSEVRREDLVRKIAEYCDSRQMPLAPPRLEADEFPQHGIKDERAKPSSSSVPDKQQEHTNHVVSYISARVLESDDALPMTAAGQLSRDGRHAQEVTLCRPDDVNDMQYPFVPRSPGPGNMPPLHTLEPDNADMPRYPMNRQPRGVCVIISNEKFYRISGDSQSKQMSDRPGTQADCEKLSKLFTALHFIVRVHTDLTHTGLVHCMKAESMNRNHGTYDCFVCCILSHGAVGAIYGTDGKTVPISDLLFHFKASSSPCLSGKPKLFFIQACQGTDKQQGFEAAADGDMETDAPGHVDMQTIPNESDFLLGMATVPGHVSYRSKSVGSWYITALVTMLTQYAHRYDLLTILTKVNQMVSEANTKDENCKQIPAPMHTLRKQIFL